MQIPVQQFPILTPGQMNPYNQALSSGLDTYQNMVKSAYLPNQLKAEIASKAAYATYSPYSYISKALSDPITLATLAQHPEQLKILTDKLASMPTDPYASLQDGSNGGALSHLWNGVKSGLGFGSSPSPSGAAPRQYSPPATSNVVPGQQGTEYPGSSSDASNFDANGNNIVATPEEINNKFNPSAAPSPSTNAPSQTASLVDAAIGSKLPLSPQGMRLNAQSKAMETNAVNEENLWRDKTKENSKVITQTQKAIDSIDHMKITYPKLKDWEKGYFGGMTPGVSSAAQKFDNYAQNLATANARAVQTGHITNADFQIFERQKVNRRMNPDAFDTLSDYHQALNKRDKQAQQFYSKAKELHDKGKLSYEQADQIWSTFIQEYPMFDAQEKLIPKNVKISPFSLGGKNNSNPQQPAASNQTFATKFLSNTFKNKEEFKQSFDTLSDDVKKEVVRLMKEGGMH